MKFKFRLMPLLKRDRFESEILSVEAKRASLTLEENEQRHQAALGVISQAETALRALCGQEQSIPLGQREILHTYLRYSHGVADACQKDTTKARAAYEETWSQLETKRLAVRTLEKQQDRKRREHEAEVRRLDSKQEDEAWLHRRGGDK